MPNVIRWKCIGRVHGFHARSRPRSTRTRKKRPGRAVQRKGCPAGTEGRRGPGCVASQSKSPRWNCGAKDFVAGVRAILTATGLERSTWAKLSKSNTEVPRRAPLYDSVQKSDPMV